MKRDIIKAIEDRVSVREYTTKEVADDIIDGIVRAGHLAPSAGNLQPWEFYVVKNKEKIDKLADTTQNQDWMRGAPVAIVICADPQISASKYGQRGEELYAIQDTSAAVENMLLAAEGYGIGSCWVGDFNEGDVKNILGIRKELYPVAFVTIGYSKGKAQESRPQRPIDDVLTIIN